MQTNLETATMAGAHVLATCGSDTDGYNFGWAHYRDGDGNVVTRQGDWTVECLDDTAIARYEWPDGSAIVVIDGAWDYGVHASRLAEAEVHRREVGLDEREVGLDELDGTTPIPARFDWPEGNYASGYLWSTAAADTPGDRS